jgi:hypothetical protein
MSGVIYLPLYNRGNKFTGDYEVSFESISSERIAKIKKKNLTNTSNLLCVFGELGYDRYHLGLQAHSAGLQAHSRGLSSEPKIFSISSRKRYEVLIPEGEI